MNYINPFFNNYNYGLGQVGQYPAYQQPQLTPQTLGIQQTAQPGPVDAFQQSYLAPYGQYGQSQFGYGNIANPLAFTSGLPGLSNTNQLLGGANPFSITNLFPGYGTANPLLGTSNQLVGGQLVAQIIAATDAIGMLGIQGFGGFESLGIGASSSMFGDPWSQAMGLMQGLGWTQSLGALNQQLTTQLNEMVGAENLMKQLFGLPGATGINYQNLGTNQYLQNLIPLIKQTPPLIFDLDGSGKPDVFKGEWRYHLNQPGFENAPKVYFDINSDGKKELTEWFGPNDGILIADPDEEIATGKREATGKDFFGDPYGSADAYVKLQGMDKNNDKKLSGDELKDLRVWQDLNQNAIVDAGELKTLKDLGITEISTQHENYESTYLQNGQVKSTWSWWPTFWG